MTSADLCRGRCASRLLLLSVLALPGAVWANDLSWAALSAEQQVTLADFEGRWDALDESRRAHLLDRAERWRSLPDARRQAIIARWNELKALSPEARQALRQRWNSLSTDERREALSASPAAQDGTLTTSLAN